MFVAMPLSRTLATALALMALTVVVTGCAIVKNPTPYQEAITGPLSPSAMAEHRYLINAGDDLEIVFFHTPELNLTMPVRPDGYISLPLADEILAAGRTPEDLRRELTVQFSQELEDPEIAVVVRTFAGARIHVGGEVEQPGVYDLTGQMTVMDAIMGAGVLTRTARLGEILVIRRDVRDETYHVIPVNMQNVINGTEPQQNIALMAFDAVFVPTNTIADINTFVDLYIRKNLPVDFGIRFEAIRVQ